MNSRLLRVDVYIPIDYLEEIRKEIEDYCCSKSGKYIHCMSWYKVQSMWMPTTEANPFLGTIGKDEYSQEYVLSFRCKEEMIDDIIEIIKKKHPYEDATIDVYSLLR